MKGIGVLLLTIGFVFCLVLAVQSAEKTPDQLVNEAKAGIKEVSVYDVKKMMDAKEKVFIIDVMDKEEYEKEHIPGAINISRGRLEFSVEKVIPDKISKVIVYCRSDKRGPLATKSLNIVGYGNAVNMKGGLQAWKEAGYPVEQK
ncbi:MAG: rhodanese-like domain-containing protein [Thermodesulfovibrionales bacterium]|nr:rhodanese-like domain-containing protein [Thermodesulfovibrionales bacterium]